MKQFGKFSKDGKVLHFTSEAFSGANPYFSLMLYFPLLSRKEGLETVEFVFQLDQVSFRVLLTTCLRRGPISGYKLVEVYKHAEKVLDYEWGSYGYGSNYSKGSPYYIQGHQALLFTNEGQLMDFSNPLVEEQGGVVFYILLFNHIKQ